MCLVRGIPTIIVWNRRYHVSALVRYQIIGIAVSAANQRVQGPIAPIMNQETEFQPEPLHRSAGVDVLVLYSLYCQYMVVVYSIYGPHYLITWHNSIFSSWFREAQVGFVKPTPAASALRNWFNYVSWSLLGDLIIFTCVNYHFVKDPWGSFMKCIMKDVSGLFNRESLEWLYPNYVPLQNRGLYKKSQLIFLVAT